MAGGRNNFSGVPLGSAPSVANSGGASGDPISAIAVLGGTFTTVNTDVLHGTQAVDMNVTGTGNTTLQWALSSFNAAAQRWCVSVYATIKALPAAGTAPIIVPSGTSSGVKLMVTNTGTLQMQTAAGSAMSGSTSAVVLAAGTKVRFDVEVEKGTSGTDGKARYAVFTGTNLEGTTPDAQWSATNVNTGTNSLNLLYVGKGTSTTSSFRMVIDDVRFEDLLTGSIAPLGADPASAGTITSTLGGVVSAATGTITGPGPGPYGSVAMIGDSQFDQFPSGTNVGRDSIFNEMHFHGWVDSDIWWHGVGAKTLSSADSTGTTTLQNVAQARIDLGGEPALWVINLGGNSSGSSESTFKANMNAILDAIGNSHPVLWFGIQGNPNTTARANANIWIKDTIEARPLGVFADVNAWIHNGRDETGWWQGDAIHLTPLGYSFRNEYVADMAYMMVEPDDVTGTATSTLGQITSAATGTTAKPTYTGTGASVLPAMVAAASGTAAVPPGSVNSVLGAMVSVAAGSVTKPTFTGTASSTLALLVAAGAGTTAKPTFSGILAAVLGAVTQAATGTTTAPAALTGTAAQVLPALTQHATNVVPTQEENPMYCTVRDVKNALAPVETTQGTAVSVNDEQLVDAINEADSIIRSMIGLIYSIPTGTTPVVPATVPPSTWSVAVEPVRYWSRDIAAYLATLTYKRNQDVSQDDPVRLRFNLAMQALLAVRNGDSQLPFPPAELPEGWDPGVAVFNMYEGNLFTAADFGLYPVAALTRAGIWPGGPA